MLAFRDCARRPTPHEYRHHMSRGALEMLPVIYTTYGIAMGHRPEVLEASGGLRVAGAEGRGKPPAPISPTRVCRWIGTAVAWVRLRHRDADSRTAGSERVGALVLPSSR